MVTTQLIIELLSYLDFLLLSSLINTDKVNKSMQCWHNFSIELLF